MGSFSNTIWWYASWKRRLIQRDLDTQALQKITRSYLCGIPFYALATVLSLINVELSLALYILIDLIYGLYGLPISFRHSDKPDTLSMGAQSTTEGQLPRTHAQIEAPEVVREPE